MPDWDERFSQNEGLHYTAAGYCSPAVYYAKATAFHHAPDTHAIVLQSDATGDRFIEHVPGAHLHSLADCPVPARAYEPSSPLHWIRAGVCENVVYSHGPDPDDAAQAGHVFLRHVNLGAGGQPYHEYNPYRLHYPEDCWKGR